ncbi:hypothetical protein RKD20_000319 [Streptomyces sp. SLBN-8D4]|jgi:hypothetical protein
MVANGSWEASDGKVMFAMSCRHRLHNFLTAS